MLSYSIMASLWKHPKSGVYYIDFRLDGKRYKRSLGTKNRKLAEIKFKELELELEKGKLRLLPSVDKWDFYEEYTDWSEVNKAPETARKDKIVLKKFFEWVPVRTIDKLTSNHLESYKTYLVMQEGLKKTTVNIHVRHIKSAMSYAVRWGMLEKNPFEDVKPFHIPEKGRMRVLTEEEEKKIEEYLLNSKRHNAREILALFRILLYTGLRIGELKNLTWKDVDLEKRLIHVTNKGQWTTKSKKNRIVPFPEFLVDEFLYLKDVLKRNKPYVYAEDFMSDNLKVIAARIGIEKLCAHDLRHSYASRLAMRGVSLYAISKLLGHSNPATTEIYAKFLPSSLGGIVDSVFNGDGKNLVTPQQLTGGKN